MNQKVVLYTTHCPVCKMLAMSLQKHGIEFEECTDVSEVMERGFKSAPVLRVGDEFFNAKDGRKWIEENKKC